MNLLRQAAINYVKDVRAKVLRTQTHGYVIVCVKFIPVTMCF